MVYFKCSILFNICSISIYLVMIVVADNIFLHFPKVGWEGVHAWVGVGKVHNMCGIHIVQY